MQVIWTNDLDSDAYKAILDLRISVFVKELGSDMALEVEGESACEHVGIFKDGKILCAGRITPQKKKCLFQRIAIRRDVRCMGYGRLLIREMERCCVTKGIRRIDICASESALGFYLKLGYTPYGEPFMRGDKPHHMVEKNI